jgi:glycosyltransferase involved in cell wall biosynthesis
VRILKVSYEFPPIGGGGAQVAAGLARELVKKGHDVDVVTMGFQGLPSDHKVDGVRIRRVDCGRASKSKCTVQEAARYVRKARPLLGQLLSENDYDLVHAHFILPDGLPVCWEARRHGVPYLITAHGSDVPAYNPKLSFRLMHPVLKPVWRHVTRNAKVVVSPSHELAQLIQRSRPRTLVNVVPNGIDPDRFHPREKKKRILVATRLVERKGVQHLLRALEGISHDHEVLIVGDGEYGSELRTLNDSLGCPGRFVGWCDNGSREFRDYLETSAIYVLPSDYENFPICLLEAMAAGAAIITTRGHGCEEVVGDAAELVTAATVDEAACISEIRSAICRLTRDAEHCIALGGKARRRMEEHFGWPAVARQYQDVYQAQVCRSDSKE